MPINQLLGAMQCLAVRSPCPNTRSRPLSPAISTSLKSPVSCAPFIASCAALRIAGVWKSVRVVETKCISRVVFIAEYTEHELWQHTVTVFASGNDLFTSLSVAWAMRLMAASAAERQPIYPETSAKRAREMLAHARRKASRATITITSNHLR